MVNQPSTQPVVVQQHEAPEAIRALMPTDTDYIDVFTLTGSETGTPEQWARAAFEDMAGLGGQFIWRVLLGLRLKSSPTRVAGWAVADRGDNRIRLTAQGWMCTGHMLVHVEGGHVALATALRYHRPVAKRVWDALSGTHRRQAPGLLRDAYAITHAAS
ncbi:hypothetical protein F4560_003366 [Saccharothrix ecbatanensis]|uniref:Uncharacterized protein n=1 Tax=Saccharothrix ecbatanensis TaxID=1105145 RepID=A0A7W9HJS7_9PSEU|nr:hypothetical protein [Saccharothrix ecbatanensis]MBB5803598.1 hypothetical protein [Saccharothrix ecbatanensis]